MTSSNDFGGEAEAFELAVDQQALDVRYEEYQQEHIADPGAFVLNEAPDPALSWSDFGMPSDEPAAVAAEQELAADATGELQEPVFDGSDEPVPNVGEFMVPPEEDTSGSQPAFEPYEPYIPTEYGTADMGGE
jgi:hypothetical protein